jgi:hypothetical protein
VASRREFKQTKGHSSENLTIEMVLFVFNLSTGESRCVSMNSTGFGVLDADDKCITIVCGLDANSVGKLPFVW